MDQPKLEISCKSNMSRPAFTSSTPIPFNFAITTVPFKTTCSYSKLCFRTTFIKRPSQNGLSHRKLFQKPIPSNHISMSNAPSSATLFTTSTSHADSLFATYEHPIPTGTASLARSKNVPVETLSAAYGHILAKNILSDIPIQLDVTSLTTSFIEATKSSRSDPDATALNEFLSSPTIHLSAEKLTQVSSAYGHALGRTVRLSALELDVNIMADGLQNRLLDNTLSFPMTDAEYDLAFSTLQDCASNVLGTNNLDAADQFFKQLKAQPRVKDLQGDGYVLYVLGDDNIDTTRNNQQVLISDEIHIVLRVRMLDGRCLISPTFSGGDEPDYVQVKLVDVPPVFASALEGMFPAQSKTIFYHPYAAHEVLPLFMAGDPPPQTGLVVDLFLKRII